MQNWPENLDIFLVALSKSHFTKLLNQDIVKDVSFLYFCSLFWRASRFHPFTGHKGP